MTQVVEADHSKILLVGGLGMALLQGPWPLRVLVACAELKTRAQILLITLIVQGSSKLLEVM